MQAIRTRYFITTKAAYIQAKAAAGTIRVPYDYSLSTTENHRAAALKFLQKYDWFYTVVGGGLENADMFWVITDSRFSVSATNAKDDTEPKPEVVITVSGGVAEEFSATPGIVVTIVDFDNVEAAESMDEFDDDTIKWLRKHSPDKIAHLVA